MSAAAYVLVMCIAWIVLIALVVSLFHGWRWIDNAIDEELNAIAPAPWGNRGEQREDAR